MEKNETLFHGKNNEKFVRGEKVRPGVLRTSRSGVHQKPESSSLHEKNATNENETIHYSNEKRCPDLSSDSDDDTNKQRESYCQSENSKKRKLTSHSNHNDDDDDDDDDESVNELNSSYQSQNKKRKLSVESENNEIKTANETEKKTHGGGSTGEPVKFASIVAAFYNSVGKKFKGRESSRIYYLRNFNNWIKTIVIDDCIERLRSDQNLWNLKVLDLCCGKGGDLIKWLKSNVRYLVMTDIADVSLEDCKQRFAELSKKLAKNSRVEQEVILADCTRDRLRSMYKDSSIQFDVVSCQFSFHYCFESLPQAECMLKNATECLKPGGFFIGTLPNASEIVKRLEYFNTTKFSNEISSLEMVSEKPYPLFGAKYEFKLDGVVDCPEFLVHFPTFERLAEKFGLKLVWKKRFDELYEEKKNVQHIKKLLKRMKALETYPPLETNSLHGDPEDYGHAEAVWKHRKSDEFRLGTLSKSEWDVVTLYNTFIFQKQKTKPTY